MGANDSRGMDHLKCISRQDPLVGGVWTCLGGSSIPPPELVAWPTAWTWTKQPTWYCDKYHWDAWNVVDCFVDKNDTVPWYFGEGSTPWTSNDGKFHFNPALHTKAEDLLSKLWLCIKSIMLNPPFVSGTPHPSKFNYLLLSTAWDSVRGAKSLADDMRRWVLEYLGFINWWSPSISGWDDTLQHWMIDYIGSFKLCDLKKWGVFVNLPRQWQVLNIGHLLAESIPVYYFWQEDTDKFPCFTQLSPTILQAYHGTCDTLDKTEVFGEEMMGYQDDMDTISSVHKSSLQDWKYT